MTKMFFHPNTENAFQRQEILSSIKCYLIIKGNIILQLQFYIQHLQSISLGYVRRTSSCSIKGIFFLLQSHALINYA